MVVGYEISPEQIYTLLKNKGIKPIIVTNIVPERGNNLLFLSFETYIKHNLKLRRSHRVCHVSADKFTLERYSIKISDREEQEQVMPRILPRSSLTKVLIKAAIDNSLFGELMTHIYTLPSTKVQKPVTLACCKWLASTKKFEDLSKEMQSLIVREYPRNVLLNLMRKPIVDRLRAGLQDASAGLSVEEAAAKNKVPVFEISYVLGCIKRKKDAISNYDEAAT